MGVKEILEFVKVEHTLFSLPFVLIGYIHAHNQFIDELPSDSVGFYGHCLDSNCSGRGKGSCNDSESYH